MVTLATDIMFLLHALLCVGNFTKVCALTAYKVVHDCRNFEKHWFRLY
jgi:hypothetical protein